MRLVLTLAAALIAGGLVLNTGSGSASAGPLPSIAALATDSSAVETVGWRRRYYRRNGVWPQEMMAPIVGEDVIVDVDDDVVVIVPVRPLSCGEYHYWNGVACIDARYNDPYLGPK